MTREIKFRDWDPETKEMQYFNLDQYDRTVHDAYGNIMQFTGLLDKNGKEIYEGDIVNAQYNISSFFKKVCVYFENGCFYVDDKNPKQNLSIGYFFREKKEIEVIGNIYENPELLTK
jgi:uncharacterized phage protein (TIGR01671 family)